MVKSIIICNEIKTCTIETFLIVVSDFGGWCRCMWCSKWLTPEEVVELSSAALGPGEIDTVIPSVRCHHKATGAACVVYSIMIYAKTGKKTIQRDLDFHTFQHGNITLLWALMLSSSPVANLMSDGDAQIKAGIFCNYTVPLSRTDSAQLGHTSHKLIPIG